VLMYGADDALELIAIAHPDPERAARGRRIGEAVARRLGQHPGVAAAIARRSARVIPEVGEELMARAGIEGELRERARELRLGSLIIVPLAVAGQPPLGMLVLAVGDSLRRFDVADLVLARELGHRAAIAVENARLYTERSQIAATLQRSLLPPELPDIPGFRLAGSYQAAGEQNDVGGDFYDVFEVPGGWMVVVGDVAGRGAEAAALTSLSRYTLRTAGKLLGDPIAAVEQLNAALREGPGLSLVSVCCVLLRITDRGASAAVVLAGHPPALHVRSRAAHPVGVFAPFLGAYARGDWQSTTVELAPGDQLVLYTDGVIDAVGEHERFGEARLADVVVDGESAADTVGRIERAVSDFASGPQVDDTAVIVVERLGPG